jgi:hypothetical protein
MNGTTRSRLFWMLLLTLLLAACGQAGPNPADQPLAAFPGFLNTAALDSAELLHQEPVADGVILLYRYQADEVNCLATVFVAQFPNGSRQAQSASQLDCIQSGSSQGDSFQAAYSKSGRFSTAYGLAAGGQQVLVEWSDGRSSLVTVQDGVFVQSRPGRLQVARFELLDTNGNLLAQRDSQQDGSLAAITVENGPLAGR